MPQIEAPSHFTQLRDWSARKHAILQKYLPTFCKVISGQARGKAIWYVDGFAGAGVYRDTTNPADPGVEGSPVLAARIAQDLPYDIQCLNVEEDPDNFASLGRETASFPHVRNIHNDFKVVVDDVLKTTAAGPAFFFLDPFGTKALPMEGLIDRIVLRPKPTDIMLRYATDAVRRLAANFEKDAVRGAANARNLDRWFRGQGWRAIIERHTGEARDQALIQYYLEQLVSISGGRLRFACSYPIRATDGTTKYHLVFATGDRLGIKLMSDILFVAEAQYEEERADYKQKQSHGQLDMFAPASPDPTAQASERISQIKASVLRQAQGGKTQWEFDNLRCTLILDGWFARLSEKCLRASCKELYADGKISRVSPGNGWSRGTEFVIHL